MKARAWNRHTKNEKMLRNWCAIFVNKSILGIICSDDSVCNQERKKLSEEILLSNEKRERKKLLKTKNCGIIMKPKNSKNITVL